MKTFTFSSSLLVTILICLLSPSVQGQQMLNPQDTIVNYDSTAPPVQPAFGKIGKWVRTPYLDWNSEAYKCYIYKKSDFRLHFPQTYKPGDGKKYPILVFYHGDGEEGGIYENELQLKNGSLIFHEAEIAGKFDGYIIFMQCQYGWGTAQFTNIQELIDTLVNEYGGDPYRVIQNGLSGGGQGVWNQLVTNPTYFAAAIPMSAALGQDATPADINILKFTPMWNLDGGLDNDPDPGTAQQIANNFQSAGANYVYKNYTTLGHDTWDSTWKEPNFWPFINRAYLSNPWPLYGKTVFCPGQPFSVTIGIVPGLDGYQWRMNGTVIPTAITNSLVVTQPGTYDARVLRGSTWSDWSHIPVKILATTPAPTDSIIQPNCKTATGTLTITGPTSAGLTYSIDGINFTTDTVFDSVAAGTYQLTVKNGSTCTSPTTTAIVNPQPSTPAQPGVAITQPFCTVTTGTIVLSSPDTGLAYSLNAGESYLPQTKFTGLIPRDYWPMVRNKAGCTSAYMQVVVNPRPAPPPATPEITVTQTSCTAATGVISISSPVDTLTYSIDGKTYQAKDSFSGLVAGSYPVTAENSTGCASLAATAVVRPSPLAPAAPVVAVTQPTCTVPTGALAITTPVDTLTYSINGTTYQSGPDFNSLTAGTYSITAETHGGCVSPASPAVIYTQPPTPAQPSVAVVQPTCTVSTGSIDIAAPADTGFMYSINGQTFETYSGFSGLQANNYSVVIRNSAGCLSSSVAAVINTQPATPATPAIAVAQPTCTIPTGAIAITTPVDTLTYSINGTTYQSGPNFGSLTAGTYSITAETHEGCVSPASPAVIFTQPPTPAEPSVALVQPTCTVATGAIDIAAPADTGFMYSINGQTFENYSSFSGLQANNYTVVIRNSAGCLSSSVAAVINTQPVTPSMPAIAVVQPTCTVPIGAIAINTPVDTLTYSINGTVYQSSPEFSSLTAGSYSVTAETHGGCISSAAAAVIYPVPSAPAQPAIAIVQPTCTVPTGAIAINTPVDTLSYSIDGTTYQSNPDFNSLTVGSYSVTAETHDGCVSSGTAAVIYPSPSSPAEPAVAVVQPTCTVSTGAIDIAAPADTGFMYSINGQTFENYSSFSGLQANNYTVVIRNSAGCLSPSVAAVIYTQPITPMMPAIAVVQPSCAVPTGAIDITSPGVPGLVYSVNGTTYQSGPNFSSLAPGNYTVTAQDSAGCVSPSAAAIIEALTAAPSAPTFDIQQPSCSSATGTILITSPGSADLMYSVDGKTYLADTSLTNLAPGTYQITAKNDSGCVSTSAPAVVLTEPVYCNVIIGVYPNPYQGEVFFNITSPYTGKGLLTFYNLLGERMNTTIETDFVASNPVTITVPMGFANRQPVIYLLTIGKKKVQGTLLPEKY
jgi:predicted esterase